MTINNLKPVSLAELRSLYEVKKAAFETASAQQRSHSEINQLYKELKLVQQELNMANLEEELNKSSEN